MGARAMQPVLIAETARLAQDAGVAVVVVVGRAIDARLIESVRRPGRIDARIVDGRGRELVAPAEPGWDRERGPLTRIAWSVTARRSRRGSRSRLAIAIWRRCSARSPWSRWCWRSWPWA
jgi:hypothetical protein